MSRSRFLVLTAGPVIIVTASAAGAWLTSSRPAPLPRNEAAVPPGRVHRAGLPLPSSATLRPECRQWAEELDRILADAPGGRAAWSIRTSPPFVVAGQMAPQRLERWVGQTIEPAATALSASYFDTAPHAPITVLLLPDEAAYRDCAAWMFGDIDISGFGYYRPEQRTLVANVGTGGGTLVHELTHALMAFDFPSIPDWFNEGLASLHEQCRFRADGKGIDGLVNWRLPDLQHALRSNELRPLAEMIATEDFRGTEEGLNYAHARYFCLYMQQRGVLERFYRTFRDHAANDPTGLKSLQRVFALTHLDAVDADFRRWVSRLQW